MRANDVSARVRSTSNSGTNTKGSSPASATYAIGRSFERNQKSVKYRIASGVKRT